MLHSKRYQMSSHPLFTYLLQAADTSLVLGHRLSEWCGHAPVLEQDLALANIALDLLGEARSYYQYAAELEGRGRTEDDLAYLRSAVEYRNPLLVEQPNGDFAHTIVRQFLFDNFHSHLLRELLEAGTRVVSKQQLSLALRGERHSDFVSEHDLRAIEVHMANLRRKLGESASSPRWIETVRGVGYRLTAG